MYLIAQQYFVASPRSGVLKRTAVIAGLLFMGITVFISISFLFRQPKVISYGFIIADDFNGAFYTVPVNKPSQISEKMTYHVNGPVVEISSSENEILSTNLTKFYARRESGKKLHTLSDGSPTLGEVGVYGIHTISDGRCLYYVGIYNDAVKLQADDDVSYQAIDDLGDDGIITVP
ncbi:hypothetical protein Pla110_13080 [Polystyrenella longa]|uniref:Uncharacterized protein n=1 Tax=Polystyrenella longa TaxID=2528007 RepID=A0A518CK57_9PLAN|nr:hypothetical protein [Polystyrenella longa]QDU79597.1 hypothetical protein Pla110_13080 [Polystyrenella longa]